MRQVHRFLAGSFALALALVLLSVPASAAGREPVLTWRQEGGGIVLTLEGLEEKISAVQLELTLEGACPDASFTPASRDVYSPDCRAEADGGTTAVTIYLVAEELMEGETLRLGTLDPVGDCRLPDRASLVLLDRSLNPLEGGSLRVRLREGDASSSSSSGREETCRVRVGETAHGTVTARPVTAAAGETVTVTAVPHAGYTLDRLTVTDSRGRDIRTVSAGSRRYTFLMPDRDVEIGAVFVPGEEADAGLPFLDIAPGAWCYDAVRYVYETGLMNGTSATTFTPNASTTRGMIVAILYRLESEPAAGLSGFTDVDPSAYYASAVAWASANGIVNGYEDNTFRPGNRITREQLAAFLYRYVRYKGGDVSDRADLSGYADAGQIASYALEPLQWANARGLVNGTSPTTLTPGGSATRAQAAVILTRLMESVL